MFDLENRQESSKPELENKQDSSLEKGLFCNECFTIIKSQFIRLDCLKNLHPYNFNFCLAVLKHLLSCCKKLSILKKKIKSFKILNSQVRVKQLQFILSFQSMNSTIRKGIQTTVLLYHTVLCHLKII